MRIFPLAAALVAVLSATSAWARQDVEPLVDVELVLDEAGAAVPHEARAGNDGTLHAWATASRGAVILHARVAGRDWSETGTSTRLEIPVAEGDAIAIRVERAEPAADEADDAGVSVRVRALVAPETEATREAAAIATAGLAEVSSRVAAGDLEGARALVIELVEQVVDVPGVDSSQAVQAVVLDLARRARELAEFRTAVEAYAVVTSYYERFFDPDDEALQKARHNLGHALLQSGEPEAALPVFEALVASRRRTVDEEHPDFLTALTSGPQAVAAADLDADGDLDLVCANRFSDTLTIFFQEAPGAFASTPLALGGLGVTSNPQFVAAADLDADGDLDLVSANAAGFPVFPHTLTVFFQETPGAFDPTPRELGGALISAPRSLATADLDGDGDLDIASANAGSHTLTVFWGGAEQPPSPRAPEPPSPRATA